MNISYHVKLIEKSWLTPDILVFKTTKPTGYNMKSGQFLQFIVPDGEKQVKRAYSICSTPADEYLEFCAKIYDDGIASQIFADAKENDVLEITPARGRFILPENLSAVEEFVFVATGTGIAPVKGLIRELLSSEGIDVPITLYFGLRHEKNIFFADYFTELAKEYLQFNFVLTLSKPSETWYGKTGRVTEYIDEIAPHSHVFLCGSAPMVMDMKKGLSEKGVDAAHMHFEIF